MPIFELTVSNSDHMANLVEYLDYLIIKRCNELISKIIKQDAEYQKIQSEMKQCFQKIEDLLPEEESKETHGKLMGRDRGLGNITAALGLQTMLERCR